MCIPSSHVLLLMANLQDVEPQETTGNFCQIWHSIGSLWLACNSSGPSIFETIVPLAILVGFTWPLPSIFGSSWVTHGLHRAMISFPELDLVCRRMLAVGAPVDTRLKMIKYDEQEIHRSAHMIYNTTFVTFVSKQPRVIQGLCPPGLDGLLGGTRLGVWVSQKCWSGGVFRWEG